MELLFWLVVWIMVSVVVGVVARSRGRSGIGFFFVSFLLSPILALIVLLLIRNYTEEGRQWEMNREKTRSDTQMTTRDFEAGTEARLAQLERLTLLWKNGALTDIEFKTQKENLLRLDLGLDTALTKPVPEAKRNKTQIFGICPNCRSTIEIDAVVCSRCATSSAADPKWRPQPIQ